LGYKYINILIKALHKHGINPPVNINDDVGSVRSASITALKRRVTELELEVKKLKRAWWRYVEK
jgi:hypothetical protein